MWDYLWSQQAFAFRTYYVLVEAMLSITRNFPSNWHRFFSQISTMVVADVLVSKYAQECHFPVRLVRVWVERVLIRWNRRKLSVTGMSGLIKAVQRFVDWAPYRSTSIILALSTYFLKLLACPYFVVCIVIFARPYSALVKERRVHVFRIRLISQNSPRPLLTAD